MSLYVGKLPPHVRQEELERVFRRFGRCNLQLKDGYGFVVYEFTANAEKALRAMRGKIICGERVTLSWSNKQPRPFQRSARTTKLYEPYRGRNFREDDSGVRIRGSQDRRDFSTNTSHIGAYNRGKHHFDDVVDKDAVHDREDIDDVGGERGPNLKGVSDEGVLSEPNPVENDRWGEPVSDALTSQGMGNGSDFDRYEPYQGYSRKDEKENNQRASSHGSPDRWSSQEKGRREHSIDERDKDLDKSKPQPTCYNCGIVGHIMRNCPEGDARREKFSKFSHRREEFNFRDRDDGRLKMLRTNSWGRPNTTRDPLISRRHARDRKGSPSAKIRSEARRSGSFPERREKRLRSLKVESQTKKTIKEEHGTQKKALKKRRARRFDTSSPSYSSSSQSHSQSSKSSSGGSSRSRSKSSSHSRSKSASSRSASSSLRSASTSSYSKSNASRSRSRLRSRSRSRSRSISSFRSLSISLDEKLPSSKNVQPKVSMSASPNGALYHVTSPDSKHHLLPDNIENSKLKDDSAFLFKVDNETNGEISVHNGDDAHNSASIVEYKENTSCMDPLKDAAPSENCREKSNLPGAIPVKPIVQTPTGSETSDSIRITKEEMFSALKHYGIAVPKEGESDISVERYFGAARLWPWEMIYYRRLKKGPLSTENYARRLEQNKEFGIVDKYVRSSSGWAEHEQNAT